jgi:hypothetical protein
MNTEEVLPPTRERGRHPQSNFEHARSRDRDHGRPLDYDDRYRERDLDRERERERERAKERDRDPDRDRDMDRERDHDRHDRGGRDRHRALRDYAADRGGRGDSGGRNTRGYGAHHPSALQREHHQQRSRVVAVGPPDDGVPAADLRDIDPRDCDPRGTRDVAGRHGSAVGVGGGGGPAGYGGPSRDRDSFGYASRGPRGLSGLRDERPGSTGGRGEFDRYRQDDRQHPGREFPWPARDGSSRRTQTAQRRTGTLPDPRDPADEPDTKRPRYGEGPPQRSRIFVANIGFDMSEEDIREAFQALCPANVLEVLNIPPPSKSHPDRKNNGSCILYIDKADFVSHAEIMRLDHAVIGGRMVNLIDGDLVDCTVCVRGLDHTSDKGFVRSLFPDRDVVNVRRITKSSKFQGIPDAVVWFVDLLDEESLMRALQSSNYPNRVTVSVATRRGGGDIPLDNSTARYGRAQGGLCGIPGNHLPHDSKFPSSAHDSEAAVLPDVVAAENVVAVDTALDENPTRLNPAIEEQFNARSKVTGPGLGPDANKMAWERGSIERVLKDIELFYRNAYSRNSACIVSNLPFVFHAAEMRSCEVVLGDVLEREMPGIRIRGIKLLGRRAGAAVVMFADRISADHIRLLESRIEFGNRLLALKVLGGECRLFCKLQDGMTISDVSRLCQTSSIMPVGKGEPHEWYVVDDDMTVLKLLALDGFSYDGKPMSFAISRGSSQHTVRAAEGKAVDLAGRWMIRFENAPSSSAVREVVDRFRAAGVRGPFSARMVARGSFELSGTDAADYAAVMRMQGVPFGQTGNVRPVHVFSVKSPGGGSRDAPDKDLTKTRDLSPDRRGRVLSGSPPHHRGAYRAEHSPGGRLSAGRVMSPSHVYNNGPVAMAPPSLLPPPKATSWREERHRESSLVRSNNHVDVVYPERRGRFAEVRPLADGFGDRLGVVREGNVVRKLTAAPSGASRGFRASPVTPSPEEFVSTLKNSQRTLLDPGLPEICARVDKLHDDILKGAPAPTGEGNYEEFCRSIPHRMKSEEMVHNLKEDDAPYAPHVWQGITRMGKDRKDPDAHCNGYMIVKRDQRAEDVKTALSLLPKELNVEYRVGLDQQKHEHLIHEDAVVFMVRSSSDTLELEDGTDNAARASGPVSGIASQKALLGMLRSLRDKQRIGLVRYTKPNVTDQKLHALCVPPSTHAFEKLGVPWRFRDMAGHDTMLVVVGPAKPPKP